jgi:hypothetical protein
MTLPDSITELAAQGVKAMRRDPHHYFDWRIRREIYRSLKQINSPPGKTIHAWLGVLAAEHVLPIFTRRFPEDSLPADLLAMAIQVAEGNIAPQSDRVSNLLNEGHFRTGINNFTWRGSLVYNAEYAGQACYKALLEATRYQELLEDIEQCPHLKRKLPSIGNQAALAIKDTDFAFLDAYGDTAASAAIAYACRPDKSILRCDSLRLFWEWWVDTALPVAWERASLQ